MKETVLRKRLIKDKGFLYHIYSAKDAKEVKLYISQATNFQVNTILHYLHMLASGKVNLFKEVFAAIVKQKK